MSENILKKLREERRLTQKQAAEALGYHTTTYARWEQEVHQIKLIDAINIANFYNVSIDYIAGITDNPKSFTNMKKGRISIKQENNNNAIINIKGEQKL